MAGAGRWRALGTLRTVNTVQNYAWGTHSAGGWRSTPSSGPRIVAKGGGHEEPDVLSRPQSSRYRVVDSVPPQSRSSRPLPTACIITRQEIREVRSTVLASTHGRFLLCILVQLLLRCREHRQAVDHHLLREQAALLHHGTEQAPWLLRQKEAKALAFAATDPAVGCVMPIGDWERANLPHGSSRTWPHGGRAPVWPDDYPPTCNCNPPSHAHEQIAADESFHSRTCPEHPGRRL